MKNNTYLGVVFACLPCLTDWLLNIFQFCPIFPHRIALPRFGISRVKCPELQLPRSTHARIYRLLTLRKIPFLNIQVSKSEDKEFGQQRKLTREAFVELLDYADEERKHGHEDSVSAKVQLRGFVNPEENLGVLQLLWNGSYCRCDLMTEAVGSIDGLVMQSAGVCSHEESLYPLLG